MLKENFYPALLVVLALSIPLFFGTVIGMTAIKHNKYYRGDVVEKYLSGLIVCMKGEEGIICVDNENPDKIPVTDLTKQSKGVE